MAEIADLLMLSGVVRSCADCGDERLFVPIESTDDDAYCCTSCGAAVLVDPLLDPGLELAVVAETVA